MHISTFTYICVYKYLSVRFLRDLSLSLSLSLSICLSIHPSIHSSIHLHTYIHMVGTVSIRIFQDFTIWLIHEDWLQMLSFCSGIAGAMWASSSLVIPYVTLWTFLSVSMFRLIPRARKLCICQVRCSLLRAMAYPNKWSLSLGSWWLPAGFRVVQGVYPCVPQFQTNPCWGCLMVTSFWVSFVAWILNIYAAMALSNNPEAGLILIWVVVYLPSLSAGFIRILPLFLFATSTYICVYVYIYIYTYIHSYIQTNKHTYMHACMHTYIHTHTCKYSWYVIWYTIHVSIYTVASSTTYSSTPYI